MTHPTGKVNKPPSQPYKVAGVAVLLVAVLVIWLVYSQFRGNFTPKTELTMLSSRAGLVMDPGAKVTYNGVQIGRVASIDEITDDGRPAAKFTLDVYPRYLHLVPQNVVAKIEATTVFGGKYVSFSPPANPTRKRISSRDVIDARGVTTEINTLFQTITSITEKVDPVKVNLTLSAAAAALTGLGDKFGQSIDNGNAILDDVNPRIPAIRHDIQGLAKVADTFANAAPDLLEAINNGATFAHTIYAQRKDLDAALLAAIGFGNTGADLFERGGPYLARGAADLLPTAQLLDTYSPSIYCTIRNYHDVEPKVAAFTGGGNGYSLTTDSEANSGAGLLLSLPGIGLTLGSFGLIGLSGIAIGGQNPYTYPENLPRTNARGGPGGAPGCWQPITRDLWPAPELVIDTGASIAPYNHFEVGSPYAAEYVYGRQVGDNTINP